MKAILLSDGIGELERVYAKETLHKLQEMAGLDLHFYNKQAVLEAPERFQDCEYIFSTWGMPQFSEEEIKTLLPSLKCVFYSAGSVQYFAKPFLNCGIKVFSAWAANGTPVAEYTAAQIILANKGFYANARHASAGDFPAAWGLVKRYPGNYEVNVGIIGAGMIGKMVIKLLKNYHVNVLVFDPFLSEAQAQALGVRKVSLETLFAGCQVVSNHLANNAQTQGMLKGIHFESMPPYAAFLNTGRGAQIVESELIEVLKKRPDITALLDVTFPEPPVEGSAFYKLENCILTSHIAGSFGNEVHRMSEFMLEEYERYTAGRETRYAVSLEMLETMA